MNYLEKTKKLYRILSYILISLMFIGIFGREILLFLSFDIDNTGMDEKVIGIIYLANLLIIMIPTIIFIYLEAKNKKLILGKIIPRTKNKITNVFLYIIFITMYISLIIIFEIILSFILLGMYALFIELLNKSNLNMDFARDELGLVFMLSNPFLTASIYMGCYGLAIILLLGKGQLTTIFIYLILCLLFYFIIILILAINMLFGYKVYKKQNEETLPKINFYRIFFHITSISYILISFVVNLIFIIKNGFYLSIYIFDSSINCMLYVFILEIVAIVLDLIFMIKNKKRNKLNLE